jgi:hypothetical protein
VVVVVVVALVVVLAVAVVVAAVVVVLAVVVAAVVVGPWVPFNFVVLFSPSHVKKKSPCALHTDRRPVASTAWL